MRFLNIILFTFCSLWGFSQFNITGIVMEYNSSEDVLLSGVDIYWLSGSVSTITNTQGEFNIPYDTKSKKLIFRRVGYIADTIIANRPDLGKIRLHKEKSLDEVVVQKNLKPLQKSLFKVQNVITVDDREMLKAACCNLSESFETNPSVDVNISDAITGAKQIQMLGLNSPYLLFTQENMPSIRGASQIYGLSFIPGSWIESIQITKGAGNVLNGYESISGQINTELVKPILDKKFFLNLYFNNYERYEFNTRYNQKITDKISSGLYIHSNLRNGEIDRNEDGFLDTPLSKQINIMNRWQYLDTDKGWVSFLNLQYLKDDKQIGELEFNPKTDKGSNSIWGSQIKTDRVDISGKIGYVFPERPYQSIGLQTSYSKHDQNSYYGLRDYNISQKSIYANAIFNSIIENTRHKFKTGVSLNHDKYDEFLNTIDLSRSDNSFGAFFEYTYDSLEKLSFIAGLRADSHNRLGTFLTPRFHLRYSLWDKASLRASLGKGKRGANIFSENQQLFASSRSVEIYDNQGRFYGLRPEVAWNYGLGFIQKIYVFNRTLELSCDFYRTSFQEQVIVDWENPREISFYNLEGNSFSNNLQVDLNYEIIPKLDIRATYKNYNISIDYKDGRLSKPFQPEHRFFINLNYETLKVNNGSQWRFDYTLHWQGKQRIPFTGTNPMIYRLKQFAESYNVMNFQVTKVFSNTFEMYLGGENINNFTQKKPIVASEDPFGPNFDTTLVFAPILGGTYYMGLRYKF